MGAVRRAVPRCATNTVCARITTHHRATTTDAQVLAPDARVIFGASVDPRLGDDVVVTMVATGFLPPPPPPPPGFNVYEFRPAVKGAGRDALSAYKEFLHARLPWEEGMALDGGEGEEEDAWEREWLKEVEGWEALEAGWAKDMGPGGDYQGTNSGEEWMQRWDAFFS